MDKPSRRELYFLHNNMVCLVKALENHYTIVDLRNEDSVYGKILNVDGYMNIEFENAIYCDSRGIKHPFEMFFVHARNVRYVHIPKNLNAVVLVKDQLTSIKKQPTQQSRNPKTFKVRRAEKYQKEILHGLTHSSK